MAETEETAKKAETARLRKNILTMGMFCVGFVLDESRIVVLFSFSKGKTKDGDMQHGMSVVVLDACD